MKRFLYFLAVSAFATNSMAQDTYDAMNFTMSDLNGTSRFVGMGGALGALGADLSTMGTNPAGAGLLRRSEASFTFGGQFTGNRGVNGQNSSRLSVDNAGAIFCIPLGASAKTFNFGINYVKRRNFFSNLSADIDGLNGQMQSQTHQMAELSNASLRTDSWGLLSGYASELYMADNLIVNDDGELELRYTGTNASNALLEKSQSGAMSQIDINFSTNFNDRVYLGLSIGCYSLTYDRSTFYQETAVDNYSYYMDSWYHAKGTGVDIKFGAIVRPFESSPFRLGLAIHTPMWMSMSERNGTTFSNLHGSGLPVQTVYDETADVLDYRFRTPWKFQFSAGHTFGQSVALGVEYELTDFSDCTYSPVGRGGNNAAVNYLNESNRNLLKKQHTLKAGVEFKPSSSFAIRAGYNFVSSPIHDNAYRTIASDGSYTETDYINWKPINRVCLGLGYRYKGGYIDLTYQLQAQKGDLYAFNHDDPHYAILTPSEAASHTCSFDYLKPTSITNNRHQVTCTVGFRF